MLEHTPEGKYPYLLAGRTALAGDLFGEYRFAAPLEVGSKVTFKNCGAYSLVKAHRFNGINLPSLYALAADSGEPRLIRRFDYEDYASGLMPCD